jgi:Predicted ATPase
VAVIDNEDFLFDEYIKPYWNGIDQIINGINDSIQGECIEALEGVTISSDFTTNKNLYQYEAKVNRLPALHFVIEVWDDEKIIFENQYKWIYQPDNQIRDSLALVKYTNDTLLSDNNFIPIFFLRKFPELSQKIETGRLTSIGAFVQDLEVEQCTYTDVPIDIWQRLSLAFRAYLEKYKEEGFYPAMLEQQGDYLANAYKAFLSHFLKNNDAFKKNNSETNRAIKSFMILDSSDRKSDDIFNLPLISASALTVLHPALVEMVASQISYLRQQFVQNIKLLLSSGDKLDKNAMFEKLSDFSKLQSPLPGILSEGRQVYTNTFGEGLFYILKGSSSVDETGIPITPDCMSNDDLDEDDISDAELTRVSEESALIERLIKEYSECYSFALDSLRIAVLLPQNVQPALAAAFKLMNSGNKSRSQNSIKSLSLLFCIDSDRENQLINWVARAKTYWQEQQLKDGATAISQFETGYRVVSSNDMTTELFGNGQTSRLDVDIILLYEKGKETSECHWINPMSANDIRLRFPLIRKFMPKVIYDNATHTDLRSQLISNYQFICYSTYQKYLNALASSNVPWKDPSEQKSAVLFEKYDFSEWTEVLKKSFDSAERVIVIGSNIDKDLIENCGNNTIIGFGSGCGSSADLNYAVATAQRRIVDVSNQIAGKVSALFRFDKETNDKVMKSVLDACDKMADLSLIRTLNFDEFYIHNFLGYSMIRHLLVPEHADSCFCDVVVSLDSYKHWFVSDRENTKRADLLWVVAYVKKNSEGHSVFDIKLTVIESKLAGNVANHHLKKAVSQVYDTLVGFEKHFKPSTGSNDVSYDSRYWWMQLHRIVTANSSLQGRADYDDEKIEALEYLAEGVYEVSFDHAVMAFETEACMVTSPLGVDVYDCDYEDKDFTSKAYVFNMVGIAKFIGEKSVLDWKNLTASLESGSMPQAVEISEDNIRADEKKALFAEREEKKTRDFNRGEEVKMIEEELSFIPGFKVAEGEDGFDHGQVGTYVKKTDEHTSQPVYTIDTPIAETSMPESVIDIEQASGGPDSGSMRILLGKTDRGEEVYWNYGTDYSLINRHMLILGSSGSGKSYAIQAILAELARYQQQSLILDYTDGFVKTQIDASVSRFVKESRVRDEKIPINPFVKHIASYGADDMSEPLWEKSFEVSERVANTFKNEYKTIGENQISYLRGFIERGIERDGDSFTVSRLFNDIRDFDPKIDRDIYGSKMQIGALAAKIETFCKYDPFYSEGKESPWSKIFYDKETKTPISIFQLSTLPQSVQLVIIEFVLWDLWHDLISRRSTVKTPHTVVLDEIQNLSIVGGSPVWKYLKEGRKLGLGLISATQSFKGLGGVNSEGADSLFGSATKLFFRPQPNELKTFASLLEKEDSTYSVDSWGRQLNSLGRGECIVTSITGDQRVRAKKIKITSLQDRGF